MILFLKSRARIQNIETVEVFLKISLIDPSRKHLRNSLPLSQAISKSTDNLFVLNRLQIVISLILSDSNRHGDRFQSRFDVISLSNKTLN